MKDSLQIDEACEILSLVLLDDTRIDSWNHQAFLKSKEKIDVNDERKWTQQNCFLPLMNPSKRLDIRSSRLSLYEMLLEFFKRLGHCQLMNNSLS